MDVGASTTNGISFAAGFGERAHFECPSASTLPGACKEACRKAAQLSINLTDPIRNLTQVIVFQGMELKLLAVRIRVFPKTFVIAKDFLSVHNADIEVALR